MAVTRAWCGMHTPVARRQCPLRPYVFGPYMGRSVVGVRVATDAVALVCAELASLQYWQRHSGDSVNLEEPARRASDPFQCLVASVGGERSGFALRRTRERAL